MDEAKKSAQSEDKVEPTFAYIVGVTDPMTVKDLDDAMGRCGAEMWMHGMVQAKTLRRLGEVIQKRYPDGTQTVLGRCIEAWYNSGVWNEGVRDE